MEIKIIEKEITLSELKDIATRQFGDMVKFVVDVKTEKIAVGGDLHADEEAILIENGSVQGDLWGINYYPEKAENDRIEFDSLINIRPAQNNRSRTVEDAKIRERIVRIIEKKVK